MSPQKRYTAGEKPYHTPGDCLECGEQKEVLSWSLDRRLVDTEDHWLPNEACTNPACSKGRQHPVR